MPILTDFLNRQRRQNSGGGGNLMDQSIAAKHFDAVEQGTRGQQSRRRRRQNLLNIGERGPQVRRLQTKLARAGFYNGDLDGIYGPNTARAVRQFQGAAGLATDGIAGPNTLRAINKGGVSARSGQRRGGRRQRRAQQTGGGSQIGGGGGRLDEVLDALMMAESGGQNAHNPNSSASGYFQYIDSTWNNYKGYSRASHAPYEVQREKARKDLQSKFNRYGNWDQAIASWLSPVHAANPSTWGQSPGTGNPSVMDYVGRVKSHLGESVNLGPGGSPRGGGGPGGRDTSGQVGAERLQALTAAELADLDREMRQARTGIQQARTQSRRGIQNVQSNFNTFLQRLQDRTQEAQNTIRDRASARGLAGQPAFEGIRNRELRQDKEEDIADAQSQKAQQIQGFRQDTGQAVRGFRESIADIRARKSRLQSDPRAFLGRA